MDLTDRLGFKADLNLDTGEIHFGEVKPALVLERRLSDMQQVLAEPLKESNDPLVHRIYRMIGDTEEIIQSGLKFDMTVILPQQFGREFPKTTGHYHLPLEGDVATPDFYQVLYVREGVIMLQKEDGSQSSASEFSPEEMQYVLIPPWMGHLTINKGDEPMVFANICVRAPHLNYEPLLKRRGAAFYQFRDNGLVPNPRYQNPQIGKMVPAPIPGLEELNTMPFYPLLKEYAPRLEFLTQPQNYMGMFNVCLSPR